MEPVSIFDPHLTAAAFNVRLSEWHIVLEVALATSIVQISHNSVQQGWMYTYQRNYKHSTGKKTKHVTAQHGIFLS